MKMINIFMACAMMAASLSCAEVEPVDNNKEQNPPAEQPDPYKDGVKFSLSRRGDRQLFPIGME